ncbi:reverse transcriptase [Tanacetum coccineum]
MFYWKGLKKMVKQLVREYDVCQMKNPQLSAYPRLIQSLPISGKIWSEISMDFIEKLPGSHRKSVIMVVVDKLCKYAHFMALSHPFSASQVSQLFLDNVYKLHGLPESIISDRDKVFENVDRTLQTREEVINMLKFHLKRAQNRAVDGSFASVKRRWSLVKQTYGYFGQAFGKATQQTNDVCADSMDQQTCGRSYLGDEEGIFRMNAENSQEEDVIKQLNIGFVRRGIDVSLFGWLDQGIGMALVAPTRGYRLFLAMPSTYSMERMIVIRAFRAELCITDIWKGIDGVLNNVNELPETTPNSYFLMQFENPTNPRIQYETTGHFLPEKNPNSKNGIERAESAILNGGSIGLGFFYWCNGSREGETEISSPNNTILDDEFNAKLSDIGLRHITGCWKRSYHHENYRNL